MPVALRSAGTAAPLAAGPRAAQRSSDARPRLAYLGNLFPNLIETMISREVEGLRRAGYAIETWSLRRPEPRLVPDEARALERTTRYVLPATAWRVCSRHVRELARRPLRYCSTLARVLSGRHDRFRDRLRSVGHFVQAVVAVDDLRRAGVDHLHAHWATGATTCAFVAGRLLDLPFSFTAHAYDIWRERLLLPQKLRAARFVVTCTAHNRDHLVRTYGVDPAKVHAVHHGTDVSRFGFVRRPARAVPTIIAVGRLVEQKGYDRLLRACGSLLAEGVPFRCVIVGDGPLRGMLEDAVRAARLEGCVELRGQVFQDELVRLYAEADLFALLCQPASDDDRDGIPNVMIEAMATGLPVVSTRFSGIPELVEHGETGLLAEVDDEAGQRDAVRSLLTDADLRARMGAAGRARVETQFTVAASVRSLDALFQSVGGSAR